MAADARYRIGEVAAETDVSTRTLRYYEELGLLTPSGHSPGGARRYSDDDVARVRRIRELQELVGFNLEEIRTIVAAEDRLGELRQEFRAGRSPMAFISASNVANVGEISPRSIRLTSA